LTCRRAFELVTAYLDDALSPADRTNFERHLDACPHCREYVAQIRTTIEATGRVNTDNLTPEVRHALIEVYRKTMRVDS
jgi:anti-sigma factor RsiW